MEKKLTESLQFRHGATINNRIVMAPCKRTQEVLKDLSQRIL